ncbi:Gram-negative bacterial TonB protein C-terminal [Myroides sp. A21]|uniref:energy transducer TonB n=1 Tax=Myroides sp. A21 TaxID=1583100 RepID=UPI00057CD728|nr:energy transducer TonB [Myroides sp. A21]AJA69032.1 Gram-negative bacterial TonB protein C-terminal [Myroides sp. A21]
MSKLNIFKKDWIDIVFEGRNKSYGAYQLRSENPKVTTVAFFAGMALFGIAIASPMLIDMAKGTFGVKNVEKYDVPLEIKEIDLPPPVEELPPPPEDVPPPPPPPVEEVKNVNDTKKFVEPEVAKKEEVTEKLTTQEDLKDADPGVKDAKGDKEKGEIKTGEGTGEADKDKKQEVSGDGDPNKVFVAVQVRAEYPGGMAAFNKQFISRFRTPDIDSGVKRIQVIVQFIVEIDGSLTDIKVARDPGYGAGKEAVRVLKSMPKWKPAIQNNRSVRSQFTLPITIQVQ